MLLLLAARADLCSTYTLSFISNLSFPFFSYMTHNFIALTMYDSSCAEQLLLKGGPYVGRNNKCIVSMLGCQVHRLS